MTVVDMFKTERGQEVVGSCFTWSKMYLRGIGLERNSPILMELEMRDMIKLRDMAGSVGDMDGVVDMDGGVGGKYGIFF